MQKNEIFTNFQTAHVLSIHNEFSQMKEENLSFDLVYDFLEIHCELKPQELFANWWKFLFVHRGVLVRIQPSPGRHGLPHPVRKETLIWDNKIWDCCEAGCVTLVSSHSSRVQTN